MRHLRSGRKLKRSASHRKATLKALCNAIIIYKRIKTTVAKAKETRMFVEKIITRAKNAVASENETGKKEIAARRTVFADLRNKEAVSILFKDIAPKVATRAGGYTRVIKFGRRLGDGAELAILELVDFNTGQEKSAVKTTKKTAGQKRSKTKTKKDIVKASESKLDKQPENSSVAEPESTTKQSV